MLGIVNKPQFDTNVFIVGAAMEMYYGDEDRFYNVLITNNEGMSITVMYYSNSSRDAEYEKITVEEVLRGDYSFKRLEVQAYDK